MRNIFALVAIGIFLISPAVAEDERTWISSSGSRIEAALVSAEGDKVVLKTADGRVLNVRMDQLSKADREYLAGRTNLSPDLAPAQQWRFDAGSVDGSELVAARGGLGGEILGESRLIKEGSLSYMELVPAAKVEGTSVAGGILLTTDPAKAGLPVGAMTVEAWVQVDSILEWGGIIGAVRDTGAQEMGWILGYRGNRFCFGLATEEVRSITYLHAASTLVTNAWYHLVATYDLGVAVKSVSLNPAPVLPRGNVSMQNKTLQQSRIDLSKRLNDAREDAKSALDNAHAQEDHIINDTKAESKLLAEDVRNEFAEFNKLWDKYKDDPEGLQVELDKKLHDTINGILSDPNVEITKLPAGPNGERPKVKLVVRRLPAKAPEAISMEDLGKQGSDQPSMPPGPPGG